MKRLLIILGLCLLTTNVFAGWKHNPFTSKFDYYAGQETNGTWGYSGTGGIETPMLNVTGDIIAEGNVTVDYILGNGSVLTGIPQYEFGANNFNGTGNFTTTGNITASYYNGNGSLLTALNSTNMPLQKIGTPTYDDTNDFINSFGSAGRKTGGVMSDGGSQNISVTGGTGFIKATDDDNAQLLSFDFPANTSIAIPNATVRYIGVEYNGGTPQIVARTSWNWNLDSEFPLGRVINENITGTPTLHIINNPWWVTDGMTNIIERMRGFGRIRRDENVGGLSLSVTGTRNIAVSGGTLWSNLNEFAIPAIDTAVTGTVELYWYHATNGWQTSDVTQYSVTQWNDVTQTALQTIDNNKYCNVWVYAEADDAKISVLYPQAQYNTAAEAQAMSQPPSVPVHIVNNGILVGRIIIKQGTNTPVAVQSAFGIAFSASVVTDHGNLGGLSDDDHPQYINATELDIADNLDYYFNRTETLALSNLTNYLNTTAANTAFMNATEVDTVNNLDNYFNITEGNAAYMNATKGAKQPSRQLDIYNITATDDLVPMTRFPFAHTISKIYVAVQGGTNVTLGLQECNATYGSCSAVDADILCEAGAVANDDGSLTNGGIAANNTVVLNTTTVNGVPTWVEVSYDWTAD